MSLLPLATAADQISDFKICFGLLKRASGIKNVLVLREFQRNGARQYLVVHPDSLATEIISADSVASITEMPLARLRQKYSTTAYFHAMSDAKRNAWALRDAGITHSLPSERGVILTIDLCPSHKSLDRTLFSDLITAFSKVEKPVPLAISLSGLWLEEHVDDLNWLTGLMAKGDITVDWINHSFHHQYDPNLPLRQNFLLEKGVNLEAEILLTEQKMIESGLTPSVFFRFPGLVSNERCFSRITALGLIPVGSDAWLAKKQSPHGGSIVLIHGNGNEPLGIKKFLTLLKKEKTAIKKKNWLLFDLRASIAQQEEIKPHN